MERRLLMGAETEYAVSAFRGRPPERCDAFSRLCNQVRSRCAHVNDQATAGLYLGNGGRFYLDSGHPEFATPECATPHEVLTYIRAGERLLAAAAEATGNEEGAVAEVNLFRGNVDYGGAGTTWGCHESYLHRTSPDVLPKMLIPHLVSRVIYTGAGGFNPHSQGIEFTLSPRTWMLEREVASTSTESRPIFHTKDETLSSQGYHRLHLICGESLCSDIGAYLKLGTTALIVAAIDAGWRMGEGLRLRAPLDAMRAIAADPECRGTIPLKDGELVTAIDVQRRYLERVDDCRAAGQLPEWSGEVCARWAEALDRLQHDPGWAERSLDWGIKLALYRNWAGGREHWCALHTWTKIWQLVSRRLAATLNQVPVTTRPEIDLERVLAADSPIAAEVEKLTRLITSIGKDWNGVRRFLKLRQELFEIDVKFGQLGDRGIFEQLERQGRLESRLVSEADIERALMHPPASGRANLRGTLIQQLHQEGSAAAHVCDWTRLFDRRDGRYVDFTDPFESELRWQSAHRRVAQDEAVVASWSLPF